jgi:enoyl-CoA hydratase/carnithine racemase
VIRFEIDGAIATIAFNRPQKKNAITAAMYQAAADAFKEAGANDAVRVIVMTGDGACFTAGNDRRSAGPGDWDWHDIADALRSGLRRQYSKVCDALLAAGLVS